jgi:hypothetical protein
LLLPLVLSFCAESVQRNRQCCSIEKKKRPLYILFFLSFI